jgi:hypothetical protein
VNGLDPAARLDEATDRTVILVTHHHANRPSPPVGRIALEDGPGPAPVPARDPHATMLNAGMPKS